MSGMLRCEASVAAQSAYWNPKTETLGRDRLAALQLVKLRRQVAWAIDRSPWYGRVLADFELDRLRSLDDLQRLPMLTRQEWMDSQSAHPPYGELPTIDAAGGSRGQTPSGASG